MTKQEIEQAVLEALAMIIGVFPSDSWRDFRDVHRYAKSVVDGHILFVSHDTKLALDRLLRKGKVERRVFWRGCYGTAKWRLK